MKYNSDLSLSEIAEEMGGISRQSVNEAQKNGEKRLLELEKVLGNAKRLVTNQKRLSEAKALVERLCGDYPDERFGELTGLLEEIEKSM